LENRKIDKFYRIANLGVFHRQPISATTGNIFTILGSSSSLDIAHEPVCFLFSKFFLFLNYKRSKLRFFTLIAKISIFSIV